MRILVFGAGCVGRGLIGKLFSEAGHYVCFVEKRTDLAYDLAHKHYYAVNSGRQIDWVGPVDSALASRRTETEIREADLIVVSVRVENLQDVADTLKSIPSDAPIWVIENHPNVGQVFTELLASTQSVFPGIAECVIPEVPDDIAQLDTSFCYGDAMGELVLPKEAKRDWIQSINRLRWSDSFDFDWDLKWYLHCAFHAVVAYNGLAKHYTYIHQAMQDKELRDGLCRLMAKAVSALTVKWKNAERIETRRRTEFDNLSYPSLPDTCARVARDAKRKVLPGERLNALKQLVGDDTVLNVAIKQAYAEVDMELKP